MKPFYQLNREVITIGGIEWNITTHSVDMTAWHLMYTKGIREPNYPAPAIRQGFEFGTQLGRGVVLLHWEQGVYND